MKSEQTNHVARRIVRPSLYSDTPTIFFVKKKMRYLVAAYATAEDSLAFVFFPPCGFVFVVV